MKMGERIRAERLRRKLSQEDVARAIDSTKQAVYKYERGIVENIPPDKIERMAQLFGVTPAYLMGWSETARDADIDADRPTDGGYDDLPPAVLSVIRPVSTVRLPMLGNVACGEPIYAAEEHETYVELSTGGRRRIDADFCLTASGDSMVNARIFDGDTLFVKKQDIVDNGEIAVVLIEDEATVKRVWYDRENNVLTLVPENPTYRTMRFVGAELDQIRILGKVVAVQYSVR